MPFDQSDPNIKRELEKHPNRQVAVVGLFDSQDRILLVRTKRLPNHWQPIGGGMKPLDVTPLATLRRELREEISLDLPESAFRFEMATGYDFGDGQVYFYSAKLPREIPLAYDMSELAEWRWYPLDSLHGVKMFPASMKFIEHLRRSFGEGKG